MLYECKRGHEVGMATWSLTRRTRSLVQLAMVSILLEVHVICKIHGIRAMLQVGYNQENRD